MTTRRAWIACAVTGGLAFVASWLFGRIPDLKACGPSNGVGAILAFEFVRSPADVAALFGAEPCRAALVAAQRTGLLLDGLWFIPAYTAFLVLAALASGGRFSIIVAATVAGLSDEVEGAILWSMLNGLPGTQGQIDALFIAVHLKFALLATATAMIGMQLMGHRRAIPRVIGLATIIMGGFALIRVAQGEISGMMLAFSIGWFALLGAAVTASLWPSAFAGSAAPPPDPAAPAA